MDCIRLLRVVLRPLRQSYAPGAEEASDAVVARSPIDIVKVIGLDIEGLERQTAALRPPLQERIKDRFHAAAWTRAVSVRTPSRSKIAASKWRRLIVTDLPNISSRAAALLIPWSR